MYTCKICGKKFKASHQLAGHTSMAHPKRQLENQVSSNNLELTEAPEEAHSEDVKAEVAPEETSASEEEPGVMDSIRALMHEGYGPKQIKENFGYHPRTVDDVAKESIEPDAMPEREKHDGFPLTRKTGGGQEVLNPEVLLKQYLDQDGDSSPGHWMFQGMMLLRAAQLMNMDLMQMRKLDAEADAKRLEPLMKMIQVSREEMDATAQRNRESQEQIAHQAAGEAAAMAAHKIDERFNQMQERKKDIAEVQDPMKGLTARTMETVINQITGQMFGGQGGGQGGQAGTGMPPGWEDKTKAGGK